MGQAPLDQPESPGVGQAARDAWLGEPEERAAGGVVLRGAQARARASTGEQVATGEQSGGPPEVAIVHRPRYDDWSLPKGKLKPGEEWLAAALREVEEETGLRCEPGDELPSARYFDAKRRRKLVRWWLMRPIEGNFERNDEVDELRWLPLEEAMSTLDYERDRELIRTVSASAVTSP